MRTPHAPVGLQPRRLFQAALLLGLGFGLALCQHVILAGEGEAGPSAAEVREALRAFGQAVRSKDATQRAEAVRTLGTVRHEKVAARLLKCLRRERDDAVLAATFEALGAQHVAARKVVPALETRLRAEAAAEAARIERGDPGFRVDPRTGEADLYGPEGRARLQATARRAVMLRALLRALVTLGWAPSKDPPDLVPFLQDPCDELVVAVLRHLARQGAWPALPGVLSLFRMYPTAATWETGAIEHAGGTNATAKAEWLVVFGHPQKQRARPKVHAALVAALKELTGEDLASPEALAEYLKRPEIRARIQGRPARRAR